MAEKIDPINIYEVIKGDKNGLVTLPKATKSMITNGPDKTAVTKEWVQNLVQEAIAAALASI